MIQHWRNARGARARRVSQIALLCVALGAWPAAAAEPAVDGCSLVALPLAPRDEAREWYVSKAATFTLEHWNYGARPDPDRFTEGPVRVVRSDGTRCEIDAGSYTSDLWVSRDETTIALVSFSGSSGWLELYDTRTCALRDRLDVSGPRIEVAGDAIRFLGHCGYGEPGRANCLPASVWRLDAGCCPVRLGAESAELTRERFGVVFDLPSEIGNPGKADARVLGPARW